MNKILKIILSAIAIVILFYTTLLLLPKSDITYMEDDVLRAYALSHNLLPTPTKYTELLKVVDNPNNPMTPAKIALGKKLFFDPILSLDKTIACASCHILQEGGDDNRATAIGYHDRVNPKHLNSPTVLNAALAKKQFWNGSAPDVEAQAAGPMQAPFEMNITPKEALSRLKQNPNYLQAFHEVFDDNITFLHIQEAIGAYERTLLTRGSYDHFLEGDNHAISAAAKRGLNLFIQKGCKGCHTGMSVGGQSMQQFPLRRSIFDILKTEPFPFPNVGGFLGENDKKRFRVPILRNITKTAPYFHNGMVTDLKEAIRIMSKYQVGEEFTPAQIEDMLAFFKTLEGELVNYDIKEQTP
jgi:cytochrome c peroxidase